MAELPQSIRESLIEEEIKGVPLRGWLKKQGDSGKILGKYWKKRYFKQEGNKLFYFPDTSNFLQENACGYIDLSTVSKVAAIDSKNFEVHTPGRIFRLQIFKEKGLVEEPDLIYWIKSFHCLVERYNRLHEVQRKEAHDVMGLRPLFGNLRIQQGHLKQWKARYFYQIHEKLYFSYPSPNVSPIPPSSLIFLPVSSPSSSGSIASSSSDHLVDLNSQSSTLPPSSIESNLLDEGEFDPLSSEHDYDYTPRKALGCIDISSCLDVMRAGGEAHIEVVMEKSTNAHSLLTPQTSKVYPFDGKATCFSILLQSCRPKGSERDEDVKCWIEGISRWMKFFKASSKRVDDAEFDSDFLQSKKVGGKCEIEPQGNNAPDEVRSLMLDDLERDSLSNLRSRKPLLPFRSNSVAEPMPFTRAQILDSSKSIPRNSKIPSITTPQKNPRVFSLERILLLQTLFFFACLLVFSWRILLSALVGGLIALSGAAWLLWAFLSSNGNAEEQVSITVLFGQQERFSYGTENGPSLISDPSSQIDSSSPFQPRELRNSRSDSFTSTLINPRIETSRNIEDWVNFLIVKTFTEHIQHPGFRESYRKRINAKLSEAKKPGYVEDLYISKIDFGENNFQIIGGVQILESRLDESEISNRQMNSAFCLRYGGCGRSSQPAIVTLRGSICLNWPKERLAKVAFEVAVSIIFVAGPVLLKIPTGTDPTCTLAFTEVPTTRFTVDSGVGNRNKLVNVPKLSSVIVSKLQRFCEKELVHPNGVAFHIPIKGERKLKIKLLTTTRKQDNFQGVCDSDRSPPSIQVSPPSDDQSASLSISSDSRPFHKHRLSF